MSEIPVPTSTTLDLSSMIDAAVKRRDEWVKMLEALPYTTVYDDTPEFKSDPDSRIVGFMAYGPGVEGHPIAFRFSVGNKARLIPSCDKCVPPGDCPAGRALDFNGYFGDWQGAYDKLVKLVKEEAEGIPEFRAE